MRSTEPRARAERARAYALAAAGGASIALAGAPYDRPALGFAGPALVLAALLVGPFTLRRSFLVGVTAGTVTNAVALYWVVGLLQTFGGFPLFAALPTAMLLWSAQGLTFGFACAGAATLGRRGAPAWLALPACLVVATTLTPDLFPWRLAGTQVSWVPWIQLAEVGGEPLLDLFVALVGCGAVECVRRRAPGAAVVAALALLVPLLYGAWRLPEARAERDRAPRLSVGVVQPNVGISEKHDPNLAMPHLRQLQDATVELEARGADLVVWPESAYPFPIRRRSVREAPGPARIRSRGVRGPVLFGTITVGDDRARYNSVVALGADGRYLGIADKIELLAFGEYVPLWEHLPPLQHYFPSRGLVPGESPRVLAIGGARVGVFNCYEDVLPEYGLRVGRLGPDLLVNATNDAWFGDTSEPWLHQSVARMRSVETRRDLVRAVNTGVSSHTASTGQDLHRTDTMVAAAFVAQARLLSGSTFWLRWGDLTTPLLAGALLGAAFALRRRDP